MEFNRDVPYAEVPKFWDSLSKTPTCWLWNGPKDRDGYGLIFHKGKQVRAHRLSYELHWTVIPKSCIVRHKCDNTSCVNPSHLVLGYTKDNSQDMVDRGRSNKGKKIKQVPRDIASKIAVEYDIGDSTIYDLSLKYGFSTRTVNRIVQKARAGEYKGFVSNLIPVSSDESIKNEIKFLLKKLSELIDQL